MALDYLTFDSNTLYNADGTTPNYVFRAEQDVNGRVHMIEELGDLSLNLYRATTKKNRVYTVHFTLVADDTYSVAYLKNQWETWHTDVGGERTVERQTQSGAIRQLVAVPEDPEWGEEHANYIEVTQRYTAANPYWRAASESSNSANYDGATPVSLACNNQGDVAAWVRLVIDGAVDTPKVAYSTEWELEFNLALSAGDELAITCQTPAAVWYTPNGGSAAAAYGYRTAATMFRKAKLPTGNNNLTLTATSGTGLCTAYWYNLYESLE